MELSYTISSQSTNSSNSSQGSTHYDYFSQQAPCSQQCHEDAAMKYEELVSETQQRTGSVTKKDFQMLSVIGKGSYGKVLLVKKKDSGKLFAIKILKKSELRKRNQVERTMTERRILVSAILLS